MTAAIFEKARKNRVLALRTVAARNAKPPQVDPSLPVGPSSRRGPRLELVSQSALTLSPDDRIVA